MNFIKIDKLVQKCKLLILCIFLLVCGNAFGNITGEIIVRGKWGDMPGEFGIQREGLRPGPSSFDVDYSGNIYVLDDVNNRIQMFDSNGNFVKEIKHERFGRTHDIALGEYIYIASEEVVLLITPDKGIIDSISLLGVKGIIYNIKFGYDSLLHARVPGKELIIKDNGIEKRQEYLFEKGGKIYMPMWGTKELEKRSKTEEIKFKKSKERVNDKPLIKFYYSGKLRQPEDFIGYNKSGDFVFSFFEKLDNKSYIFYISGSLDGKILKEFYYSPSIYHYATLYDKVGKDGYLYLMNSDQEKFYIMKFPAFE